MKKWITPELLELKVEMTQNAVETAGSDSYGETAIIPGLGEVQLGSCC